ncbi:PRC-barrel domain-containing protein [Cypionkella psychrotolerans]|uniref:PRC-barrel domain-containing protein n=1 Tax=Cypionkella psychrotolerans TaxID=1678131 RepID=UPI0006B699FE|nr:PRC-barrel domain-containing protein [Cypionkella psychrotolerans]
MLLNLSTIRGHSIEASDGTIGFVSDVLFDDTSWMIRWLVVDTGDWLPGRKVLLPPSALGHAAPDSTTFPVRLTRAQVKASPDLDTHRPVSRQFETSTYDYYGWSPYWGSGYYMGGYGALSAAMPMRADPEVQRRADDIARHQHDQDEPHLRSAEEVSGYHIHATDGEIGHLSDLIIEDTDWSIHFLIVDTSNWWMGQKVLVSPRSAQDIRWTEQLIYLDVNRQKVKDSPPFDPAKPVDRAYEDRMAGHYAKPRP